MAAAMRSESDSDSLIAFPSSCMSSFNRSSKCSSFLAASRPNRAPLHAPGQTVPRELHETTFSITPDAASGYSIPVPTPIRSYRQHFADSVTDIHPLYDGGEASNGPTGSTFSDAHSTRRGPAVADPLERVDRIHFPGARGRGDCGV